MHTNFQSQRLEQAIDIINSNTKSCTRIFYGGLWSPFKRTFYDGQVVHPNSPSYLDTTPKQLLVQKEKDNVLAQQVEKGTFTPLLYTTFGGWGPQATAYQRRILNFI